MGLFVIVLHSQFHFFYIFFFTYYSYSAPRKREVREMVHLYIPQCVCVENVSYSRAQIFLAGMVTRFLSLPNADQTSKRTGNEHVVGL